MYAPFTRKTTNKALRRKKAFFKKRKVALSIFSYLLLGNFFFASKSKAGYTLKKKKNTVANITFKK